MERVKITKENFFSRFKPASEILLENGDTVTSEPVLEMIRKGKQFMELGDVDGFKKFMLGSEYDTLSNDDARLLSRSVMTEGGTTVFQLISDICDLTD
jgi:hypothetical protein